MSIDVKIFINEQITEKCNFDKNKDVTKSITLQKYSYEIQAYDYVRSIIKQIPRLFSSTEPLNQFFENKHYVWRLVDYNEPVQAINSNDDFHSSSCSIRVVFTDCMFYVLSYLKIKQITK